MSALAPIPPKTLKQIIERAGYTLLEEEERNWLMYRDTDEPIVIPKRGPVVDVEVLMEALHRAKINNREYFEYLEELTRNTAN